MRIFGVINTSTDSLNLDSICVDSASALARATRLLDAGANGIDLGGQASTDAATVVDAEVEWSRLATVVPALATLGVPFSVDTWRPSVARRALAAGATVLNAADGLQSDEMMSIAADTRCEVVMPFLSGPDPRSQVALSGDPIQLQLEWFEHQLRRARRYGIASRVILDPGTGFAPPNTSEDVWYRYQKYVYSNLGRLRQFGLPLYVAVPWRDTERENEILALVLAQGIDYARAHDPAKIRRTERQLTDRPTRGVDHAG